MAAQNAEQYRPSYQTIEHIEPIDGQSSHVIAMFLNEQVASTK